MSQSRRTIALGLTALLCTAAASLTAQDWPQWRGANRDGKATGFKAPKSWPAELTQKWKVEVGDGVSTPSLVGDKLYVFARQGGDEVVRCLDAASGKELWKDSYPADAVRGPAGGHSGPRASPAVAEGKVVTQGVQGTLSCYDAASGKRLWRDDEYKGSVPQFANASSPVIVDGACVAQVGSERNGGIVAYDLETGKAKWKWIGDGPGYGSPVVTTVGDKTVIVAPTGRSLVALDAKTGKDLWKTSYSQGRYNAATPLVHGSTVVVAGPGRGMTAWKLVEKDGAITAEDLWVNEDNSVQYNTPILHDGLVFGLSGSDSLFCFSADDGTSAWSEPFDPNAAAGNGGERGGGREGGQGRGRGEDASAPESAGGTGVFLQQEGRGRGQEGGRRRGGFGGGRGGRGGTRPGYGSVVDAGSALFALTPAGQLTVYEPSKEKLNRLATYKVAEGRTYAYPVVSGNRIYIKDGDSVTLWTIE